MTHLAVLLSGFGSNFQAILDAVEADQLPGVEIVLAVSNHREAYGIQRAIAHGIPVVYFPLAPYRHRRYGSQSRQAYDADLAHLLQAFDVDWVVLAGWMHILGDAFLSHFPGRVVNLHPALPGTFPGTNAIARAYKAYQQGEIKHTGVMVHLVPDEQVDAGPVVDQAQVLIKADDSPEDLETRIHQTEHRLLVQALYTLLCEGSKLQDRRR